MPTFSDAPTPGSQRISDAAPLTVAFVDLVRFTSLTDVHGDLAALDAAAALESIAEDALGGAVEMVKTLGDAVLLVAPDPLSGLRCVSAIIERLHDAGSGADARAGIHHGPVVRRGRDVFGATVNLAARLGPLADRGTMAVTRPIAIVAGDLSLPVLPLGRRSIRGLVDDVEVFQLHPCEHSGTALIDPVCGMRIAANHPALTAPSAGSDVAFCSQRCASMFREDPSRYLG